MTANDSPSPIHESSNGLTRRRTLAAFASVATVAASAGCISITRDRSEETITESINADTLSTIDVATTDGDIVVRSDSGESVEIRADKHAVGEVSLADLSLETLVEDDHLRVETTTRDESSVGSGWIDLDVTVPATMSVDATETTDGDIEMIDVSGDPAIRATDGDLNLRRIQGDLDVTTKDGDVTIEGTEGSVAVSVTDGEITIREPGALDTVTVTDGDVTADVPDVTSDGLVKTTSGDIVVHLGRELDAQLEASTSDGSVSGTGALDSVGTATETYLEGTVGDGSNTLELQALDGDITLRRS